MSTLLREDGMIPKPGVILCATFVWGVGVSTASAQQLNSQQIQIIRDTAASICDTVKEAKGQKSDLQIQGDVKAQLGGLFGKVVDVGGTGKGSLSRQEFEGLSRDATATAVEGDRGCRERVFDKMFDKLSADEPNRGNLAPVSEISRVRQRAEEAQAQAQDARADALRASTHADYVQEFALKAQQFADTLGDGRNGYWSWVNPDGGRYSGQYQNGGANGYGVIIAPNGDRYAGSYVNNTYDGYGVTTYRNGGRYEGEYRFNRMDGYGVEFNPDGSSYQGQYRNGARMGYGVYTWRDGTRYEGEERNGVNGYGVKINANSVRFESEWRDSSPEGWLIVVATDGSTAAQYWSNGSFIRTAAINNRPN